MEPPAKQRKLMTLDPATPYEGNLRFLQIIDVDNDTHEVTAQVEEGPDMLRDIYEGTLRFTQHVVEQNPRNLRDFSLQSENFILRATIASLVELAEFAQLTPFKWWGRGVWEVNDEDRKKLIEEVVDELHFAFARLQWLECDTDELYAEFMKKLNTNWQRFEEKIGWKQTNP